MTSDFSIDFTQVTQASLDICTKCQLRCPVCSTSRGIIRDGFIGEGMMSLKDFQRFLDLNPQIRVVEMSNWGEVFLNLEIVSMMKLAYERGVRLTCGNGTNFNFVSDEVLEALVKYRFWYLNISIDGASEGTYSIYRRGGSFSTVMRNIIKLNVYKSRYQSEFPKLSWQFIVFGHNEHEISKVRQLCRELGMVFNPKMNHSNFSPVKNREKIKADTGLNYASRSEFRKVTGNEYKSPCYQCVFSPQINWNGEVLGCCVNKWGGLGNAFEVPLVQIMTGKRYSALIAALCGKLPFGERLPCMYCPNKAIVERAPLNDSGFSRYKAYVPPPLRIE